MDHILVTFLNESRELLEKMEGELLAMERGTASEESINAIFRTAHTIKGSAGMFGFDGVVSFTHVVETTLDQIRSGTLLATPALVALLLECQDHIRALIESVAEGGDAKSPDLQARSEELISRLQASDGSVQPTKTGPEPKQVAAPIKPSAATEAADKEVGIAKTDAWHISVRYGRDVMRQGSDPLVLLRYLSGFGEILALRLVQADMPSVQDFDPEACYLGFEFGFKADVEKTQIESAFEFVRDDCELTIISPRSRVADYIRLLNTLPEGNHRLGELLVQCGSLTQEELNQALRRQAELVAHQGGDAAPALGEVLIQQNAVSAPVVEAALEKQSRSKKASVEIRSVRVDAEKLDNLIDLVGELIIAGAATQLIAQRARLTELSESVSQMARLVEDVRDQALNLRMVPIGASFTKFQRIVRDTARELGKEIGLEIAGAETELDKTLVEQIGDPLTHLVRNSIDHGIESVDRRIARGKKAEGTIRLNAYHDAGSVVIEVADDGGGLPRDKILAKAIAKGLVKEGQALSDREIYSLIFEAGFSTAEQVTNLSGRGVGMDVVRRNVADLRGTIEIDSVEGRGTTTRIRLPLTLAIIDGFLVRSGQSAFVIPLDMVEECIELQQPPAIVEAGHRYIDLRGAILPFIRLRERFAIVDRPPRRENVVVVRYADRRIGIAVDELLGEMQAVIKPLASMFNGLHGVAGSTILGDGSIALILDVPSLAAQKAGGPSAAAGMADRKACHEAALF